MKELEKFGLHRSNWNSDLCWEKITFGIMDICVYENRKVVAFTSDGNDILFDLIQAGLVEKGVKL